MLISHESPLAMLEESRQYNDYDYALVHLFETEPSYYKFFEESLACGRHVILDNSIFELGKAFDSEKFADYVRKLKPTYYIIPDVLEDALGTMDSALDFTDKYSDLPGKSIGVVQGKSYEQLAACYQYMDEVIDADKIAISFDYSYYKNAFPHHNKWISYALGRYTTLHNMLEDGIINTDKPHHLLGCSVPIEFSLYRPDDFGWIESLDTSNPIVHGLLGVRYTPIFGLLEKKSVKLVDLLHLDPSKEQKDIIDYNIEAFRTILNLRYV